MKSPSKLVILLLVLTTAAGGYVSWREYNELIALRGALAAAEQRAAWTKRRAAAEFTPVATAKPAEPAAAEPSAEDDEPVMPNSPRRPRRERGASRAFFDNPQAQKLIALQQRAALDAHYAGLFKKLGLSPEKLNQFKNLLVEKQSAMMDVAAAARAQGLDPRRDRDEFRALVSQTQAELDNNIRSVLGDAAFSEYQQYQQTLPQRTTAEQFAQRLSYTATPLTPPQTEQLVQILAQTSNRSTEGGSARANFLSSIGVGGSGAVITDAALTQAQGVLSPDQLAALQQFQQEQLAQQQLMRSLRQGARPAPASATPPPAAAPSSGGG